MLWMDGRQSGWQGEDKQKPGPMQDEKFLISYSHACTPFQVSQQLTQKPQILPVPQRMENPEARGGTE